MPTDVPDPEYDFIIVGAGASGCVLANRLSADPKATVLLVESGPWDRNPLIRIPRAIGKLLVPGNPLIASYAVTPAPGRPLETWLKGRGIGGSTLVNGMGYARGAPLDYDGWAALGCAGWSWADIAPYFTALEHHSLGPGAGRGVDGPQKVSVHPEGNALCEAILAAGEALGTARVADINSTAAVRDGGLGYQPSTTWRGRRESAADAFIHPIRARPNLHIVTDTEVVRVRFEDRHATGVVVRAPGGERTIACRGEVLLSAGAIETPKLLQLSGIGPASMLGELGIPVVVDAPEVGRNLREHRYVSMMYRVRSGSYNPQLVWPGLGASIGRYAIGRRGPLGHAAQEVGGFIKTTPGLAHADAQIAVGLYSMHLGDHGVAVDRSHGISIITYITRPQSTGELRIVSTDPAAPPVIAANQLSAEADRLASLAAIHWVRALVDQPALKSWVIEETAPGPAIGSDEAMLEYLVAHGGPAYHVCGTARMGADQQAVLDPQLRVRGVRRLRVVDTSVMPMMPSGNTAAPAMVIAMRAADFIISGRNMEGSMI